MAIATKSKISVVAPQGWEISEDDKLGIAGQFDATDSDPTAALSWSVAGGGTGLYGSLSVDKSGHWSYLLNQSLPKLNALAEGETATETFVTKVVDSNGAFAYQKLEIDVAGANDAPVVLPGQSVGNVHEDFGLSASGQVKAKDFDHGAVLSWSLAGSPSGNYGSLSIDPAGKWTYSLDNAAANVQALAPGEKAVDTFTVQVTDQFGASATKVISVNVLGTEDRPVISGSATGAVKEDVTLAASGQLTANDPDHGAAMTWSVGHNGIGAYGTLAVDQTGHWTYTLNNASAKVQALNEGQTVTDTFTVKVADQFGGHDVETVTIAIAGTQEGPVIQAAADLSSTTENQPVTVDVLANDTGTGLSLAAVSTPAGQGSATVLGNKLVFDPGADFDHLAAGQTADVVVNYTAHDQFGGTAGSTATITVAGQNDAAAIGGVSAGAVAEDGTLTASGKLAVSDVDAGEAHFQAPASLAGAHGNFSFDAATGDWSYALDNAAAQSLSATDVVHDALTVTSADGSASQVIDVTVTGADDAPTVSSPLTDQTATDGTPFALTLPAGMFADVDAGDSLAYSASLAGGAPLPSWLTFDPVSGQFSGTPGAADVGSVAIDVTATDGSGAMAVDTFNLTVGANIVPNPASPFTVIDPAQSGALAGQIAGSILGNQPGIAIDPASLTMTAGASSAMFYDGSLTKLGIGPGLLITSGTTPATSNTVGYFGVDNAMPGDPALDAVVNTVFNTVSYDATTIGFSFTVTDPTITGVKFNAVFGSDEFPEWVNQFVDIGVVLVNGQNVAYFNNDPMAPLSVIGSNLAANYFVDNTGNLDTPSFGGAALPGVASTLPIEYDGVSNVLSIFAPVHQGVNTIEIGIADTGDHIYDSGLFISNMTATNTPSSGVVLDVPCTDGNDNLTGTSASEVFDAKGGDDVVFAGAGNDVVLGGAGNDQLDGGDGNDTVDGGAGNNIVNGGAGDDAIQHHAGALDHIDGGAGFDTLKIDSSASSVGETVAFGQTLADGTTVQNVESLDYHGGSGDDVVTGGVNADSLDGGAGNDVLTGGGGNDHITGGDGVDTAAFNGNAADYQVTNLSTGVFQVSDLTAGSPDGTDTLNGVEFLKFADQTLDLFNFGSQGVTIQGTAADDIINVNQSASGQPLATNFGDSIHGDAGDDKITGGSGSDTLYGDAGNDQIKGGDGNDVIVGGAGHDELTGGNGADTFVFTNINDSLPQTGSPDQIFDFRPDQGDHIDLSQIDAIPGGNHDPFSLVSAFTGQAGELTQAKIDGGYLVQGDITGDGQADFAIHVDTVVKLTHADFFL